MKYYNEYDELLDEEYEEEKEREPQCWLDIDCEACNQKFCHLRTREQW